MSAAQGLQAQVRALYHLPYHLIGILRNAASPEQFFLYLLQGLNLIIRRSQKLYAFFAEMVIYL